MTTILAIDAGNSRTKWGLYDAEGNLIESDACMNAEINRAKLPNSSRIVISNVAGEKIKKQLENILPNNTYIHWISAKSYECGVKNNYAQPDKLGTDRWAALIGAWHIKQAPCVVVNAGTAVTIDAITLKNNKGEFIGGMILPGIHLMQQCLGVATAQLPNISLVSMIQPLKNVYHDIFAKNTADAMLAGAINATCGAVTQIHTKLAIQCRESPHILISGGNAQLIKDNLLDDVTNRALIVDNLVLRGLYLIENLTPINLTIK
jgi:type III pantothenate kinase